MEGAGFYTRRITLADVRAARPAKIYYGASTCWWTHDPRDLYTDQHSRLPCDPRSGMLFETQDIEGFLANAELHPEHYGQHGLYAFEAAHHGNVQVSRDDCRWTCFRAWEDYNRLLDEAAERGGNSSGEMKRP